MRPCSGRTAPTLGPSRGEQALRLQSGIRAKGAPWAAPSAGIFATFAILLAHGQADLRGRPSADSRPPRGTVHVGSKADVAGQWPAPPKHVDAQPQINRLRFRKLKSMKRTFRGLSRPTGPPHGAQNNHRAADSASEGTTNHSWYTIAT